MNTENTRILGPEEPFQEGDWCRRYDKVFTKTPRGVWVADHDTPRTDGVIRSWTDRGVIVYRPLSNTPETEVVEATIEILPISKAPEDRRPLLLWCKVEECWVIGSRDAGGYAWGDNIEGDPVYLTHFAELPPPMNESVLSIKEEV